MTARVHEVEGPIGPVEAAVVEDAERFAQHSLAPAAGPAAPQKGSD